MNALVRCLEEDEHSLNSKIDIIHEKWAEYASTVKNYTSIIKMNGVPILPPLMSADRRREMQMYQQQANIAAIRLKARLRSSETSRSMKATSSYDLSRGQATNTEGLAPPDIDRRLPIPLRSHRVRSSSSDLPLRRAPIMASSSSALRTSGSTETLNRPSTDRARTNAAFYKSLGSGAGISDVKSKRFEARQKMSPVPPSPMMSRTCPTADLRAYVSQAIGKMAPVKPPEEHRNSPSLSPRTVAVVPSLSGSSSTPHARAVTPNSLEVTMTSSARPPTPTGDLRTFLQSVDRVPTPSQSINLVSSRQSSDSHREEELRQAMVVSSTHAAEEEDEEELEGMDTPFEEIVVTPRGHGNQIEIRDEECLTALTHLEKESEFQDSGFPSDIHTPLSSAITITHDSTSSGKKSVEPDTSLRSESSLRGPTRISRSPSPPLLGDSAPSVSDSHVSVRRSVAVPTAPVGKKPSSMQPDQQFTFQRRPRRGRSVDRRPAQTVNSERDSSYESKPSSSLLSNVELNSPFKDVRNRSRGTYQGFTNVYVAGGGEGVNDTSSSAVEAESDSLPATTSPEVCSPSSPVCSETPSFIGSYKRLPERLSRRGRGDEVAGIPSNVAQELRFEVVEQPEVDDDPPSKQKTSEALGNGKKVIDKAVVKPVKSAGAFAKLPWADKPAKIKNAMQVEQEALRPEQSEFTDVKLSHPEHSTDESSHELQSENVFLPTEDGASRNKDSLQQLESETMTEADKPTIIVGDQSVAVSSDTLVGVSAIIDEAGNSTRDQKRTRVHTAGSISIAPNSVAASIIASLSSLPPSAVAIAKSSKVTAKAQDTIEATSRKSTAQTVSTESSRRTSDSTDTTGHDSPPSSPHLVRSNSYTLTKPSPALVRARHSFKLKADEVKRTGAQRTVSDGATPPESLTPDGGASGDEHVLVKPTATAVVSSLARARRAVKAKVDRARRRTAIGVLSPDKNREVEFVNKSMKPSGFLDAPEVIANTRDTKLAQSASSLKAPKVSLRVPDVGKAASDTEAATQETVRSGKLGARETASDSESICGKTRTLVFLGDKAKTEQSAGEQHSTELMGDAGSSVTSGSYQSPDDGLFAPTAAQAIISVQLASEVKENHEEVLRRSVQRKLDYSSAPNSSAVLEKQPSKQQTTLIHKTHRQRATSSKLAKPKQETKPLAHESQSNIRRRPKPSGEPTRPSTTTGISNKNHQPEFIPGAEQPKAPELPNAKEEHLQRYLKQLNLAVGSPPSAPPSSQSSPPMATSSAKRRRTPPRPSPPEKDSEAAMVRKDLELLKSKFRNRMAGSRESSASGNRSQMYVGESVVSASSVHNGTVNDSAAERGTCAVRKASVPARPAPAVLSEVDVSESGRPRSVSSNAIVSSPVETGRDERSGGLSLKEPVRTIAAVNASEGRPATVGVGRPESVGTGPEAGDSRPATARAFMAERSKRAVPNLTNSRSPSYGSDKIRGLNISPEVDKAFCRLSACVKGYLTRRLFKTEKVVDLLKTVKDCRDVRQSFSFEMPAPAQGMASIYDQNLRNRLDAQLHSALCDLSEIFFNYSTEQKMSLIEQSRTFLLEKHFKSLFSQRSQGSSRFSSGRAQERRSGVSTATLKVMERKKAQQVPATDPVPKASRAHHHRNPLQPTISSTAHQASTTTRHGVSTKSSSHLAGRMPKQRSR